MKMLTYVMNNHATFMFMFKSKVVWVMLVFFKLQHITWMTIHKLLDKHITFHSLSAKNIIYHPKKNVLMFCVHVPMMFPCSCNVFMFSLSSYDICMSFTRQSHDIPFVIGIITSWCIIIIYQND
jgi:hypothetical protein